MKASFDVLTAVVASVLTAAIVAALAYAERQRSEEAAFSPLYRSTLESAFSRFREGDKRVPAGGAQAEADLELPPVAPPPPPAGSGAGAAPAVPAAASAAAAAAATVDLALGNQHAAKKEYDQALACFARYLQKDPTSAVGYHRVADVLLEQGKLDEAIAAYRQALVHQSTYYCVFGHIADILVRQGKQEAAEQDYAKLVAGYTGQLKEPGAAGALARFQLAKFYIDHNRNIEEAIPLAEAAAVEAPDQVSYLVPLVTAYKTVGRNADAVAIIDRIVQLNPDFAVFYRDLRAQLAAPGAAAEPDKK
jgi:tetratricopeptide (TPR) repeat protein